MSLPPLLLLLLLLPFSSSPKTPLSLQLEKVSKFKTLPLSIEDLLYFAENDILTPSQTKSIWEFLWKEEEASGVGSEEGGGEEDLGDGMHLKRLDQANKVFETLHDF